MYTKVRRTFAFLCIGLTGLVLLVACLLSFLTTKTQMDYSNRESFEARCEAFANIISSTNELSYRQIYQMEIDSQSIIYVIDNGQVVTMPSSIDEDVRDERFNLFVDFSTTDVINSSNFTTELGSTYIANVTTLSSKNGANPKIVTIASMAAHMQAIDEMIFRYICIFVVCILMLSVISWILAKRSIKPVEIAEAKQKEFIAAASHELKSPLAIILSGIDMVEMKNENVDELLKVIRKEIRRLSNLVDDLLILAGSDVGKWRLKKKPTNIEDAVVSAYESHLSFSKSRNISLHLKLPNELLSNIHADEERLTQTIGIILMNAIQYSPSGSSVILGIKTKKKEIEIFIQDNGPGIDDTEKQRIFERFYRREIVTDTDKHLGLGLAIAKELITMHDGHIVVADTPGGGTTFTIVLPYT